MDSVENVGQQGAAPRAISDTIFTVLDVETTGLDHKEDRIVEFALMEYSMQDGAGFAVDFLVNPGRLIPPETSAIHHLTNHHVVRAMSHEKALERIARLIPEDHVVVGHNVAFDLGFLPCLAGRKSLCTKRLAQHLAPQMPRFNNQVLRYALLSEYQRTTIDEEMRGLAPHRAKADVIVTTAILAHLLRLHETQNVATGDNLDALLALAASPIRIQNFPFGKHFGKPIAEIAALDPGYLRWCLREMTDLDADLRFTIESALKQ